MRLPRVRFTVRRMMVAAAIVAVLMVGFAEQGYRWDKARYHDQQQRLSEENSMGQDAKGKAALAVGRRQQAAQLFASSTYWNGQAESHERMKREYLRRWWVRLPY